MCTYVDSPYVAPGWGCCGQDCHQYNSLPMGNCKHCRQGRCDPLKPDPKTGRGIEAAETWGEEKLDGS